MYEEYTDKQIVKMLVPKLAKMGYATIANNPGYYPDACKLISTIYKSGYIRGQLGRSFIIGEKKEKADKIERWIPATKDNVKADSKVKYVGNYCGCFHPKQGTVGVVDRVCEVGILVQWPRGSTSRDDRWYCGYNLLEVLVCE